MRSTLSRRGVLAGGALVALAGCRSDDESKTATGRASSSASGSAGGIDWNQLKRAVHGNLVLPSDPTYNNVRLTQNPNVPLLGKP